MGLVDSIKKQAQGNNTMIQSTEAADLGKIFNKMFYLDKDTEKEVAFVKHIITRGQETQERRGLHASSFIKSDNDFCVREQVLSLVYRQIQRENVNVGLMRIFEEGNAIHEKWQRLFLRAGYSDVLDLDFTQMHEEYQISFTPDILCVIPEYHDEIMVGEIKSVNTYQFQKMSRHPSAYKQLQWYMYLSGYQKGFVLCEDKNTQAVKIEVYEYDPLIVNPILDRAEEVKFFHERLIKHHKMVGRPLNAIDSSCKRCIKCSMRNACWGIGKKEKL